jgi:hypothetical protein
VNPIRVVNVKGLKGDARNGVCYVGRAFAGWPASPWGNPFKPKPLGIMAQCVNAMEAARKRNLQECIEQFRKWFDGHPQEFKHISLYELWKACDHGVKPLGCWCINATHGDGQEVECHAQVLAELLTEWVANNPEVR